MLSGIQRHLLRAVREIRGPQPISLCRWSAASKVWACGESGPYVTPSTATPWVRVQRLATETSNANAFRELGVNPSLCQALGELGITVPTPIQGIATRQILKRKSVLLSSETGSGKTFAFLVPVVQLLKEDEIKHQIGTRPARPRALVIVPSRELALQTLRASKGLSHHAKFQSMALIGGITRKQQRDKLSEPIDLLIATPGRLRAFLESEDVFLSDTRYVILDEADTLLRPAAGFLPDIEAVLSPIRKATAKEGNDRKVQYILCGATHAKADLKTMKSQFPMCEHVQSSSVHKRPKRLQQEFIRVKPGLTSKPGTLIEVLSAPGASRGKTMVFCNTISSCRATDMSLNEAGIMTLSLHGDMPKKMRQEVYAKWVAGLGHLDPASPRVLVTTDAAARGLDFQGVDHVVNYDFPLTAVDYLHRAGRTARAGRHGTVTNLLTKRDEVLAKALQEAGKLDLPMADLSSDKNAYLRPGASSQAKPRIPKTLMKAHKQMVHKKRVLGNKVRKGKR